MRRIVLSLLILITASISIFAQSEAPMLFRQPTMNRTDIVFVFAGDLWRVSRSGGAAERLMSAIGTEANPFFSPDGNSIAFTGEYDGNVDAYVVPATGGEPQRVTYHAGADQVI